MWDPHRTVRRGTYLLHRQSMMLALLYTMILAARPVWCQAIVTEVEGKDLTAITNITEPRILADTSSIDVVSCRTIASALAGIHADGSGS